MSKNDFNSNSIIFQHLRAEESRAQQQTRIRFANNVRVIWGERAFLVRISALGLILGVLVALLIPTRYTATTRLMPPDNQSTNSLAMAAASIAASGGGGGFGEIAGNLLGLKSNSDVFVGILSSRTVQNHIIEQFDLKALYGVSRMEDARKQLSRCVGITIDRKNEMITISVSDHSPQRAAHMAAAFTEQLNRLVSELSTSSARRERIFLEARLTEVNQDLETAEKEFSQFSSKNSAINIQEQGKAMLEVAGSVQGKLMLAQSELEGLRQIYSSDSHVRVRALKARIAELQSQLGKLGGKDQAGTLDPGTGAADLYPSIRKLPLLGVAYADLYRRTKVQETVYGVLTQEYELAKVQEAREIPTVKILDPPEIPEKKDFPPRTLIALSSTGLAFSVGTVLLLATKSWNDRNPGDLSKAIVSEIWFDLKNKRFLNSAKNGFNNPETEQSDLRRHKRTILSFFSWKNTMRNSHGPTASSTYVSEAEPCKKQAG